MIYVKNLQFSYHIFNGFSNKYVGLGIFSVPTKVVLIRFQSIDWLSFSTFLGIRLIDADDPPELAMTAFMRKILVTLNARALKNRIDFRLQDFANFSKKLETKLTTN